MPDIFKVGVFQFDIAWEDISANKERIETLLASLTTLPDLLVLPEMYLTGFSMNPSRFSVKSLREQLNWQVLLSIKYGIALIGSLIQFEKGNYYNRMVYTASDGSVDTYNKRHLFFDEKTIGGYKAGVDRKLFECQRVKLFPQVCYDLRFPVWSRNNLKYQLLIYSANWPGSRQYVWEYLLKARALENQCYVIGVNRVGEDGNSISYLGGSTVIGPKGDIRIKLNEKEDYSQVELSMKELALFRRKFPVLNDADDFTVW